MRLSAFILQNMEPILQDWEDFARALGAVSEGMDVAALRDHAEGILREVAADIETAQSAAEQDLKSKGLAPKGPVGALPTAARLHGTVRIASGFTLGQVVSEFRALRASVVRHWGKEGDIYGRSGYDQITRFHESIDEALAASLEELAGCTERKASPAP